MDKAKTQYKKLQGHLHINDKKYIVFSSTFFFEFRSSDLDSNFYSEVALT